MKLKSLLPALTTAAVLAAAAALRVDASPVPPEGLAAYFEAVRGAVEDVPLVEGPWSGQDVEVPQSAQRLLKPNVILSRAYRSSETGVACHVLLVHCRDARDMVGHYPPVCYPSQGWTREDAAAYEADLSVPHATYHFSRTQMNSRQEIVIHGFFALPNGTIAPGMDEVRRAEGSNLARPLGAAQIQLLFPASTEPALRAAASEELLVILRPALEAILQAGLSPARDPEA